MALVKQKSITLNGQSIVEVNGMQTQAVYMSASIPENGNINVNKVIQNKEAFELNREQCISDIAEFESYVYSMITE